MAIFQKERVKIKKGFETAIEKDGPVHFEKVIKNSQRILKSINTIYIFQPVLYFLPFQFLKYTHVSCP